ncbi:hypothetical protein BDN70DRAFT_819032 [Pholiota conissans]|uniref:Cytochrome c oxidase assembly factor 3 n=1 Tax=Pholiota conissans TaxID=109636 RepID=A0A9P6CU23_9AGAR|nr:hypothetical protein BDN70DRAFT_819032 [Pholiota conissans]
MSQYIDRREAQKSYRPTSGSMSPGLKRAREPYRVKNALLGLALGAFAVGVWAYSISAVKQDIFDDVDEEAKALSSPLAAVAVPSPAGPEQSKIETAIAAATTTLSTPVVVPPSPSKPLSEPVVPKQTQQGAPRGILQHLDSRLPSGWLLDPQRKTLVWGAPSVDNVGKLGWS